MTRIESTILELERIGFRVLMPAEAEHLRETAHMLARWGDECFPPANEHGQRDFGAVMLDAAALDLISIFYPLRELCAHEIDAQAGCCRRCGIYEEEMAQARLKPIGDAS